MRLIADLWSVLTWRQRRWTLAAQLLSLFMAFSTIAGIASIAPFFAVLGNAGSIGRSALLHRLYLLGGFSDARSFEIALGAGFVVLVLASNVINAVGSFLMLRLAWAIGTDLQSVLFEEYLRRPYAFHARTHSAELFNNIIHETTRATNEVLQNAFLAVTNIVTASFIVVTMLLINPAAAAGMIAVLGGGYVAFYLSVRERLSRSGRAQTRFYTEQTKIVNESLAAIREIIVRQIQGFFAARFRAASRAFGRATAQTQVIGQSPKHLMECVAVIGLVLAALLAGGRDEGLGAWLGKLTFLGFAAYRLLPALQQTFAAIVRIRADRAGFATIAADLKRARAAKNDFDGGDPAWISRPLHEICLSDVYFRYEPDRAWAVAGISARIPARGITGLVGANGSGKTTVADLIAGLLTPDVGSIEVDGTALGPANRAAWQARIAYVPQFMVLLDTSIEENIALGTAVADIDRQRLAEASQLAQLDEFVPGLPGGHAYGVGERGVKLSGGQRQRIGIARALYADAAVLILDEATNALDGMTEHELMAAVQRLRGRCTIIVIAHRLSTLRACDLILELERGRLARSGTYAELFGSERPPQTARISSV